MFAPFPVDSGYFGTDHSFMANFRVDGFEALVARLEDASIAVRVLPEQSYGRFAHLEDPEGNQIELWKPIIP